MPSKNSITSLKTVSDSSNTKPILNKEQGVSEPPKVLAKPTSPKVKRINKGFQVEVERGKKWDMLVAKMKAESENKKATGPELLDEALDYLFDKYLGN